MANIAVNLWDYDLLQQRNTQTNILVVSRTCNSDKNIIRYYKQQSPAIQAVQEHKATITPLEVQTALPTFNFLTEKPIWVKQWPLAEEKL